jgi:hypothetical protein
MRTFFRSITAIFIGLIVLAPFADCRAKDYNDRFIKNYPPGYFGMYYQAQRFIEPQGDEPEELYRWDRYMSQTIGVTYPYMPIPYPWDYGTGRTFNLPDYNSNDWPSGGRW